MFLLGHTGLTAALGELLSRRGVMRLLDIRVLLIGSILPDMVDKPLAFLLGIEGRNVGHSLLFSVALTLFLALPLVLPRLYPRRVARRLSNPLPLLSIGLWTHLLLDMMWLQPRIALWPFLRVGFEPAVFSLLELILTLMDPYVLGGELAGLGVLTFLTWKYRLYRKPHLLRAIRSGILER